jgi:hypothetical protein
MDDFSGYRGASFPDFPNHQADFAPATLKPMKGPFFGPGTR